MTIENISRPVDWINSEWNKEESYRKTVWRKGNTNFTVTMRLNPVLRKYQVYSNDGDMEVKDYGTFGLRQEDVAEQYVERAKKEMDEYIRGAK